MKLDILAVSDLHGFLPEITKPADIAIIAGDIIPLKYQFDMPESKKWLLTTFLDWVLRLPVNKVFLIAGNHDSWFERSSSESKMDLMHWGCGKLVYLENELFNYCDTNGEIWSIFGTPYCHIYGNWPFMRTEEYMTEKFKLIPDKVDIIISHDPPFAICDADVILDTSRSPILTYEHIGNPSLANRIQHVDYKLLVCGHIHGGDHELNPWFHIVNVSYLNEGYKPYYKPFYTTIEHGI